MYLSWYSVYLFGLTRFDHIIMIMNMATDMGIAFSYAIDIVDMNNLVVQGLDLLKWEKVPFIYAGKSRNRWLGCVALDMQFDGRPLGKLYSFPWNNLSVK